MLGSMFAVWSLMYVGFGILAYGIAYFLVHEVFIHQRFKWFRNSETVYLKAIRRAHKIHHKHIGKENGECFGMLVIPWKYIKEEIRKVKY
jgi:beta-carotene 3-hydroxylase